jgi:phage protein D
VPAVSYNLLIDGAPASPELLELIQEIEVEDHAEMADMLRIRLSTAVSESGSGWTVLDDDLFPRLTNIKILVTVGSGPSETLIEAHVIVNETEFSNEPGESGLEVVAMDPTVLMNLEEKVRPWPNMADSDIAEVVFGEYRFDTDIEPTQPARPEVDHMSTQRGTDIQFLKYLAERNGYECYVEVAARGGRVEGHFHPPRLEKKPQGVLSINMGESTNINSFKASNDMLGPTTVQVTGLDIESHSDQPAAAQEAALVDLGRAAALEEDRPRRVLLSQTGLALSGELQTYAQAVVDRSSWAITAEGELNTVAYGGLLRAKRPVLVRGAGRQFSGLYYVEKVLHTLTADTYVQRFSLKRNALGLTQRERFVEDKALPA